MCFAQLLSKTGDQICFQISFVCSKHVMSFLKFRYCLMFRNSGIRGETFSTRAVILQLQPCELCALRLSQSSCMGPSSWHLLRNQSLVFEEKIQIAHAQHFDQIYVLLVFSCLFYFRPALINLNQQNCDSLLDCCVTKLEIM